MGRKTKEEFIEQAQAKHGYKFDYNMVEYVNSKTKVKITCPIHGIFEQLPSNHLKGCGCKRCTSKSNTTKFIEKANKKHNNFYNYDKTNYIDSGTKVTITCPLHGDFEITPSMHLTGFGCPYCAGKLNKEIFIERSRKVHGETYDYSKVIYKKNHEKVIITCKIHGDFEQRPSDHMNGKGCPKCKADKARNSKEEFIEKAILVHGYEYDYSRVDYKSAMTKVEIGCPKHGWFWQTPNGHLNGDGCKACANEALFMTQEEWLVEAKKIHGEKYDYSLVEYVNSETKVKIICPIHGIFEQRAGSHIRGQGCPKCANNNTSKPEQELFDFVKELYPSTTSNNYKIITPKELDIYIPELNKAIEFNGLYWHYSKDRFIQGKHALKSNLCRQKGIQLLHVREELWLRDKERMKEVILRFLKNE